MTPLTLIGISGKAGTGKDYLFETFLRPLGFYATALADPLKEIAIAQGLCSYEEAFHTKPPHVRETLQTLGTEGWRNQYGADVWCRFTLVRMRRMAERTGQTRFAVTDVRFLNEVRFIQQNGGVVYRIFAPDRAAAHGLTEEQRQHRSETDLDLWSPSLVDGQVAPPIYLEDDGKQLFDAVIDNRFHQTTTVGEQVQHALTLHDVVPPPREKVLT